MRELSSLQQVNFQFEATLLGLVKENRRREQEIQIYLVGCLWLTGFILMQGTLCHIKGTRDIHMVTQWYCQTTDTTVTMVQIVVPINYWEALTVAVTLVHLEAVANE